MRAEASRPIVVLDHQPYDIVASDRLGVDIHLSGHTHRGQVWPLSWLTDAIYDQSHGYRKWENTHAYVSSGLSLWGPPFRIGTHSDMAVIDIE
jgi:predicted MPP superfamily phosphohydrolase